MIKYNNELIKDFTNFAELFSFEEWKNKHFPSYGEVVEYHLVDIAYQKIIVQNWHCNIRLVDYDDDAFIEQHPENELELSDTEEFESFNQWFYDYNKRNIDTKSEKIAIKQMREFLSVNPNEQTIEIAITISSNQTLYLKDVPKSAWLPFCIPVPKDNKFSTRSNPIFSLLFLSKKRFFQFLEWYQTYENFREQSVKHICQDIDNKINELKLNEKYGLISKNIEIDGYFQFYQPTNHHQLFIDMKKHIWRSIESQINLFIWQKYAIYFSIVLMFGSLILEYLKPDYLGFWNWLFITWFCSLITGVRVLEILQKWRTNRQIDKMFGYIPDNHLRWQSLWDWHQKMVLGLLVFCSIYLIYNKYFQ